MNESFLRIFPEKLRFWALHCVINALPSYLIAIVWIGLWPNVTAHLAMLAATITFVIGYSVFTAWWPMLREGENLFIRAMNVGLVVRTVISVMTILAVPIASPLLFSPDLWCGLGANWVVSQVMATELLSERIGNEAQLGGVGFFEIYATTIIQGLMLSFMLFVFSFVAIIILQLRDRRNPLLWRGKPNP